METWGVALFLKELVAENEHKLGEKGPDLVKAGQTLVEFLLTLKECGPVLQEAEVSHLLDIFGKLTWTSPVVSSSGFLRAT